MPSSNSSEAPSGPENIRKQLPRPRSYHISSYFGTVRSTSFSSTTSSSTSTPVSSLSDISDPQRLNTTVVPGKNRTKRLLLIVIALFPPFTLVMVVLLPSILLIAAVLMYSLAWFVFWSMAAPKSLSAMPLHPRKIWKLNKAIIEVIVSNIGLLPVGISLIKYRYFAMRGSTKSSGLLTDIQYMPRRPSNKLDIYIPEGSVRVMDSRSFRLNGDAKAGLQLRPVIVFIYGGGWASGNKWMYTLVGARLREMGYVVFIPEYSVFPKGTIQDMEQEVRSAIQWAFEHCEEFGGDPQRIYIAGHSAGAHLCALAVLNDCIRRTPANLWGGPSNISKSPILSSLLQNIPQGQFDSSAANDVLPRLRGMMLYSGVYDICEHYKHESMRGVEELSAMGRLMGGTEESFRLWSPKYILQELIEVSAAIDKDSTGQTGQLSLLQHLKLLLPVETLVVHGDKDKTVPIKSSTELFAELKALNLGPSTQFQVMEGMGHEEPVVAIMPSIASKNKYTRPLIQGLRQFMEGGKYVL
ncbi:hypothetical protein MVEG_02240 [Podila verticillata NRRL 6337]|nr:hypothetical protein MVEG_02240 [Podila verticillata NRRL 6337]